MKKGKTPGIKVRVAKDGVIQLLDRATGRWLANVRWRPHGEVWVELEAGVRKNVLQEGGRRRGEVNASTNPTRLSGRRTT